VTLFEKLQEFIFLVKFLSEGELDSRARLAGPAAEQAQSEDMVKSCGYKYRFYFSPSGDRKSSRSFKTRS